MVNTRKKKVIFDLTAQFCQDKRDLLPLQTSIAKTTLF